MFIVFNAYMPCHDASQSYEAEVDILCQFVVNTVASNGIDNACILAGDSNCNDNTIETGRKCVVKRDIISAFQLTSLEK